MSRCFIILGLVWICLVGCQQRLTEEQWTAQYKPVDVNEAQAMAIRETAQTEAKADAALRLRANTLKLACIAGLALCIGTIVAGQVFGLTIVKQIGILGLIVSGTGWGLLQADNHYGEKLGVIGLVIGVCICIFAFVLIGKSLIQVVRGNEIFKQSLKKDDAALGSFKLGQEISQDKSIAPIITKLRGKINAKEIKT